MNFGQIISRVREYLNRNDIDSVIPDFINTALIKLEQENNFTYMLAQTPETHFDSGVQTIDLPARFKTMDAFEITDQDGNKSYPVATAFEIFNKLAYNNPSGKPVVYSIYHDKVYLCPTPGNQEAVNLTYSFHYYQFSNTLSNDLDTNWITENNPHLLIYAALLEAEPFMINDQRIITWKSLYEDALAKLRNANLEKERPRRWIIANGVDV